MAIDLKKLRCTSRLMSLHLASNFDGTHNITGLCEACGSGKTILENVKDSQLLNIRNTRDALAQAINALAGLSMNCAIPERLRNTISEIAGKLDHELDKADGLDRV